MKKKKCVYFYVCVCVLKGKNECHWQQYNLKAIIQINLCSRLYFVGDTHGQRQPTEWIHLCFECPSCLMAIPEALAHKDMSQLRQTHPRLTAAFVMTRLWWWWEGKQTWLFICSTLEILWINYEGRRKSNEAFQSFALFPFQKKIWSNDHVIKHYWPFVAFRRFQQCRVFAVSIWTADRTVAAAVSAMTLIAVRFGPAPTRPTALHLYVLLRKRARAAVLAMGVQQGGGVPAAAVTALRGEAEVGPTLVVTSNPVQLCHRAAPRGPSRQGAAGRGCSAPWGSILVLQNCEVVGFGIWIFRHQEMCCACFRSIGWMQK